MWIREIRKEILEILVFWVGERNNFRRLKFESVYIALYVYFYLFLFVFVCMSFVKLIVNEFVLYEFYGVVVVDVYYCDYYLW